MTINKDKKKFKSKPIVNKYAYCIVCGSNPIIKIDNAREYICTKCLPKYFKGKTNWNLKKKQNFLENLLWKQILRNMIKKNTKKQ